MAWLDTTAIKNQGGPGGSSAVLSAVTLGEACAPTGAMASVRVNVRTP